MSDHAWLEMCLEGCAAARAAGATEAEVFAQHAVETSVTIEKGDLQLARSSTESTFGVRALVGDQLGFASTNAASDLAAACRDAVILARSAPGDPHNRLPEPRRAEPVAGLDDPNWEEFTAADAVRCAVEMLRVSAAFDKRVIVGDAGVSSVRLTRAIANTRGAAAAETVSLFSHHILVTAREDERVSSMDFQYGASRRAREIDVAPTVILACRNAVDSLGTGKGRTFRGVVILSPSAALEILVSPLLFQVNARNVLRGLSRWDGSLGAEIAAPTVSVADDGTAPGGIASSSFDREGTPRAPLTLIERGRLASFLHNAYSSSASTAPNTGHAAGPASSPPMIGPTNLTFAPGAPSLEEQIADTELGLLVGRFSGNVDPISGDFSGVAKAAHLVQRGRRAAVSETLVAGNVFDALRAVLDTSSDVQRIFGFALPYVRLDGISVTAG